jgi:hypothetical protein
MQVKIMCIKGKIMKCYCKQEANGFYFVVEGAPEDKHELIKKAFFEKHGDIFLKWYPTDMPDKEIVIPNYERLAPDIFLRNKANWENALNTFCTIAKNSSINFVICGSASASIHGVDISPTDLDINIDVNDFNKLKDIFKEYIIEPLVFNDSLLMVKYFGRLCIDNVWIDVSALSKKGFEIKEIEIKFWNGHIIYVQSLRECLDKYKAMENGKKEYIKKIENHLK